MAYKTQKKLLSVQDLHQKLPLSREAKAQVEQDRKEIAAILRGDDDRKILVIGPCSAWPDTAVLDYAQRLRPLKEKYQDTLKIILRLYIQKPRTTVGWVGPVNQPDPYAEPDVEAGLRYCRAMMIRAVEMGFALADEAVYTHKKGYLTDLYAYTAIGARSAEDQEHRIYASMIDNPVGMKNPTSGDLQIGINSIVAAQWSHTFVINGEQIKTSGNPYAHLILRGGASGPNSDTASLLQAMAKLEKQALKNPAMIVDVSHDNSLSPQTGKKDPLRQPQTIYEVLESIEENPKLNNFVRGFMVESFIEDGGQKLPENPKDLRYGCSITDGCLGWEKTEIMIEKIAEKINASTKR
jgi:3-deoxy-7-phosphoheptulonate synthase